jgi:hypothetical protein
VIGNEDSLHDGALQAGQRHQSSGFATLFGFAYRNLPLVREAVMGLA